MASTSHMTKSNRGFAAMDTSKQREIASKGGRAAHAQGTAHEFSPDEAREAGRKGGMAVSRDRDHMSLIGRKGGEARGQARRNGSSGNGATRASNSAQPLRDEGRWERALLASLDVMETDTE